MGFARLFQESTQCLSVRQAGRTLLGLFFSLHEAKGLTLYIIILRSSTNGSNYCTPSLQKIVVIMLLSKPFSGISRSSIQGFLGQAPHSRQAKQIHTRGPLGPIYRIYIYIYKGIPAQTRYLIAVIIIL